MDWNWNTLLFVIFPYVALFTLVIVTIYRSFYRPFSISSLSSQLLERRWLFWGSIPFHWGITIILTGHLLAIFIPQSLVLWNGNPLRLYLLEISGLALGMWATVGMTVLLLRRLTSSRVQAVSTPMDYVVILLVLVSLVTGVIIGSYYRWGSYWFTGVFTPYVWSILTFRPQPELVAPLPFIVQLHVFNFFALAMAFSFSRLVHIIAWPIGYLWRPWQLVIWNHKPGPTTTSE